ncbi:hypothetical protein M431DRAFT_82932, partial [Trichoderma harzianum CBS 226.95]
FRPNRTLPEAPGVFVNASNVRSTMEIIWSCIGIIILSTWSILNPNIPPDFRKQAKWQLYLQKLYSIARKALWMIVMFVAPEALTSLYAHKMFSAHHNDAILKEKTLLKGLAYSQEVPWSRTHTLFADMGGFALLKRPLKLFEEFRSEVSERLKAEDILELFKRPNKRNRNFIKRFELKQSFFFGWFGDFLWKRHLKHEKIASGIKDELERSQITHGKLQTLAALSGDIWVLDSAQLIVAVKEGIIELPKSKSDALVKTLAIMQVLWLTIQLAARRYYGLASAPFEISTVALSASTIILYVLEWNKPKDVSVPIYLQKTTPKDPFEEAFKKVFEAAPYPYLRFPIIPTKLYHIPSCAFHVAYSNDDVVSILSFGGIHIFAWNFFFPTKIEQQLWRVCSVAATVLPLPYLATHYSFMKHGADVGKTRLRQIRTIQGVLALFYVLARLFLIIESLRSLYYLPRYAFESTWSVNFPHWG